MRWEENFCKVEVRLLLKGIGGNWKEGEIVRVSRKKSIKCNKGQFNEIEQIDSAADARWRLVIKKIKRVIKLQKAKSIK